MVLLYINNEENNFSKDYHNLIKNKFKKFNFYNRNIIMIKNCLKNNK